MLNLSGTLMDTMSSGSSRAGIPNSLSATSNAFEMKKERERGHITAEHKQPKTVNKQHIYGTNCNTKHINKK